MSKPSLMAGVSRFAHLAGLSRGARADAAPAEDEDQVRGKGGKKGAGDKPDDEDGEGNREGEGKAAGTCPEDNAVTEDNQGDTGVGASGAADDNEQGDDGVPAEGGQKKGENDESDDDEAEMRGSSPAAKARVRERDRIAAIFACPQAASNLELACSLAFETRLPRNEAIAVLKKGGSAPGTGRSDRVARNPTGLGRGGPAPAAQGRPQSKIQQGWGAALAKAGVTKPR